MKAIRVKGSGGLERLTVVEMDAPGVPQEGEIQVRLHASSLNYHDYLIALGKIPTADGLIPLTDGAGIVERIGEGVSEFGVGDTASSRSIRALDANEMKPVIDKTSPLPNLIEAFRYEESAAHLGKICIEV
jgi:NADPH:quinone reductase-like Zn-dependent oxidoreductase